MTPDRVLLLERVSRDQLYRTAAGRNLLHPGGDRGYARAAPQELHAAVADGQVVLATTYRYVLTEVGALNLAAHYFAPELEITL